MITVTKWVAPRIARLIQATAVQKSLANLPSAQCVGITSSKKGRSAIT